MPSFTDNSIRRTAGLATVLFVVYPGVKLLDLAGPLQVFNDAVDSDGDAAYRCSIASIDGKSVISDTPVSVSTEPLSAWSRRRIDTLIVVGGQGAYAAIENQKLLTCVRKLAQRSRRVGSVCNAAFLLARCGLLQGRRAVTHWDSCERLAAKYPDISVEKNPIFVSDGDIWTSAGVTAGIDMAIAMVSNDLGRSCALSLARSLVTYLVRPGGQSQFSEPLEIQTADDAGRFDDLHKWMRSHLGHDLCNGRLADQMSMSTRNFSRLYTSSVGRTPAKSVEAMRVEAACQLLEQSASTLKTIASRCGFGDDERMRRAFIRALKISPLDYRKRFHAK